MRHGLQLLARSARPALSAASRPARLAAEEDRLFGDARGEELPPALVNKTDRLARLHQAKARLEAEAAERQQRYASGSLPAPAAAAAKGRPQRWLKPRPRGEAPKPGAAANVTDPDGASCTPARAACRGYNAQAVATEHQIVAAAGITERPDTLLADSGCWSIANLTQIPDPPELLIPSAKHARQGRPRKDGSHRRREATGCARR